jgi:site-specific DNA recombinase
MGVAMAVAAYLRVSTDEQRERQTIATQRDFAERFCSLHTLSVSRVYADDGVSGTIPFSRRPEGSLLLRDARLKKFDQLLVYRLDRLGRDTRLTLEVVAELEKHGVRVKSMTEEFDTATASGRLMLTMLSGFAAHERDVIRERSMAGTDRVAQAGAWLGGIVPYGYRKLGEKNQARIVVSEERIANLDLSEAEIIRTIFRMAATEKKSCFVIAEYLNRIGAPCAYVRDERMVSRGKRKASTSGLWRPGRVRNLLVNSTYMGRHEYGKRSPNPNRQIITRAVPAIVSEELWQKAQKTLKSNILFSKRHSCHQYLLRGLMKCRLCGLTYIGVASRRPSGKQEFYYRCNGKHGTRGLYGASGQRCPSKDVNGDFLEQTVWTDVEAFLRNPKAVIEQLQQRLAADRSDSKRGQERLARLEGSLAAMTTERDRILALFRKGRITEKDLGRQMDQIDREEAVLRANIEDLSDRLLNVADGAAQLQSTQALLEKLRGQLDAGISWEVKRQLIEALVGAIRIDTIEENGKRRASIVVTYRFASSIAACTDAAADSMAMPPASAAARRR